MSTHTDRSGSRRRFAVAVGLGAVVLAAACGGGAGGDDEQGGTGDTPAAPAETAQPAEEGDDVALSFTFTGEDGADGCRYDGPSAFVEGVYATELDDTASDPVTVNLDPLASGVTYEDFLEMTGAEEGVPVRVPTDEQNPESQEWLGGDFRTILQSDEEAENVRLLPGRFVAYCWTTDDEGSRVWPAGQVTVEADPDA